MLRIALAATVAGMLFYALVGFIWNAPNPFAWRMEVRVFMLLSMLAAGMGSGIVGEVKDKEE